jgi:hypothetical protein
MLKKLVIFEINSYDLLYQLHVDEMRSALGNIRFTDFLPATAIGSIRKSQQITLDVTLLLTTARFPKRQL